MTQHDLYITQVLAAIVLGKKQGVDYYRTYLQELEQDDAPEWDDITWESMSPIPNKPQYLRS